MAAGQEVPGSCWPGLGHVRGKGGLKEIRVLLLGQLHARQATTDVFHSMSAWYLVNSKCVVMPLLYWSMVLLHRGAGP